MKVEIGDRVRVSVPGPLAGEEIDGTVEQLPPEWTLNYGIRLDGRIELHMAPRHYFTLLSCRHCNQRIREHVEGQCLFQSTNYEESPP